MRAVKDRWEQARSVVIVESHVITGDSSIEVEGNRWAGLAIDFPDHRKGFRKSLVSWKIASVSIQTEIMLRIVSFVVYYYYSSVIGV